MSKKQRVYELAEKAFLARGEDPTARDVVDVFVAEGGHRPTGQSEFSRWKRDRLPLLRQERAAASPIGKAEYRVARLTVGPDGAVVLPSSIRAALRIEEDGTLLAQVSEGVLTLVSPAVALERVRPALAPRSGMTVVDELLADRRRDAADEG